jgi:2-(1,2-epoxy-1,2-dihydrophenyl)acetyl-CoA isomerase
MMMLAEKVTAAQALEYGMIYRVAEPETLMDEARRFAASLAAQATVGLGLTKRLLNASLSSDLDSQLELEARLQAEAARTTDHVEGIAAFQQKRAPRFEGR